MDFNLFNAWLIENYDFNAFENVFFEKALYNAYKQFATTTINGVTLPDLYRETLFEEFLDSYRRYLKLLLRQIPPLSSNLTLNIEGICLNDFSHYKNELQQKILLLDAQL